MVNKKTEGVIDVASDVTVSDETLAETPAKVVDFLRGVGTRPVIAGMLAARGYSDAEHENGWRMLHLASGFKGATVTTGSTNEPAHNAMVEIDHWDEGAFRIGHAALQHAFPEQCAFVFDRLQPSQGPQSILGVTTFLDRLDALQSSPDRKHTRAKDHAALEKLSARGIGTAERARIRGLLATAQSFDAVPAEPASEAADRDKAQHDALVALRAWYEEWSEVARVVVRRRDYLIVLGLAQRKTPTRHAATAPDAGANPKGAN